MKSSKTALLLGITVTSYLLSPLTVFAQQEPDFEVYTKYTIDYEGEDYVTVSEEVTFSCNNEEFFYPAQEERQFNLPDFAIEPNSEEHEYKISTVVVEDENGNKVPFTTEESDTGVIVEFSELRDVTKWNSETFTVSYRTHELIDHNGNIVNLYLPGLPEDVEFNVTDDELGLSTIYSFETEVMVPVNSEDESYIYPIGAFQETIEENKRIYSIEAEDRKGETAWIQLGSQQFYYFKLVQPTPKTDNLVPPEVNRFTNLISTNVFEIPLPREHPETNQKVLISKITPEPLDINLDIEGNYIALFEMPANQESEIVIEGYVTLENIRELREIPDIAMTEYAQLISKDPALQRYLTPGQYWEIEDPVVSDLAKDLTIGQTSLLDLIKTDYDYLVDTLHYSYSKVESDNSRLGAVSALNGAPAVCMEYSDAMIAILRAQGIPARAAIGYGNDPTGAENSIGDEDALVQNIGHQWLEAWVPKYGWLSVDPTWGESERTYIGSNLDHILWYTIGSDEQKFIGTTIQSADPIYETDFESYDMYLRALSEREYKSIEGLIPLEEIILSYEDVEIDQTSIFIKTTSLGKIIVIAVPVVTLLIIFFFISSIFTTIVRMRKSRRSR